MVLATCEGICSGQPAYRSEQGLLLVVPGLHIVSSRHSEFVEIRKSFACPAALQIFSDEEVTGRRKCYRVSEVFRLFSAPTSKHWKLHHVNCWKTERNGGARY